VRDATSTLLEDRPEPLIESLKGSEYPVNIYSRRDTLFQRVKEKEEPALLKAEF
jgi:hypothetical protein